MSEEPPFYKKLLGWLHAPGTYSIGEGGEWEEHKFAEGDDIWSDVHIFNDWMEIQNRVEWYESPNIPSIYEEHKYIFKQNMEMGRPIEKFFMQNKDSNDFRSTMIITGDLPSNGGGFSSSLKIKTRLRTRTPPSGENEFGGIEYLVRTYMKYDMPQGIQFLPRLVTRPLNKFFRWAFMFYVGEERIDYDGEYAREKTREYFQYLRKYHGEEPVQTKTRQAEFKPVPEEGVFFQ